MKKMKGFTLIELMIVVAIVAIITAIALPSYQNYARKGRRADGLDALLFYQAQQEKWRASNVDYATLAELNCAAPCMSDRGFYTITVTAGGDGNATGYQLQAVGTAVQNGDTEDGVPCTTLVLTVNAANPRGVKGRAGALNDATCWG